MHAAQTIFSFALLAVIAIGSFAWSHSRSISLINSWAQKNGFIVLSAKQRFFRTGPFFPRVHASQTIYFVTLQDQTIHTRNAYILCGSFWFGLLSRDVTVAWDISP